ncbi:MAG: hypothetical protein JKX94_08770 [Sneathiella sp.]|nr:hypothetical protein [Sneathiella sp.]
MSMNSLNIKHDSHYGIGDKVKKRSFLTSFSQTILTWQTRASMRYRLADLDKENLSDIGLSRQDLSFEANKPFWQN